MCPPSLTNRTGGDASVNVAVTLRQLTIRVLRCGCRKFHPTRSGGVPVLVDHSGESVSAEIGGEQAVGLGLEEGGPFAAHGLPARGWAGARCVQDPVDAGRTDSVPQATEFAVDAPEAPSWVLGAEPDDQVA